MLDLISNLLTAQSPKILYNFCHLLDKCMVEIKCSRVLCMNFLHKHVIVAKTNES